MADETKEGLAGYDESLPENPFTNPDVRPKSTLGFQPDPMARTVRELPGKLLTQADENLTKNIVALTPKPKESRYGSIRMPRMSDDPMNAGNFILAGPIAVEEALGRFAAKALPAKTVETKLLQMGASKAELETRGVTQYLEAQGTRPVHPLEVMKHLDDNPYQLNEIINKPGSQPKKVYYLAYPDGTTLGSPFKTSDEARTAIHEAFYDREGLQIIRKEIQSNPNPPKFEQWQTPGGENYREILLQHPPKYKQGKLEEIKKEYDALQNQLFDESVSAGMNPQVNIELENRISALNEESSRILKDAGMQFTGGHWPEPNVVAHMRVNDRTLPSGERALHVEEWQSDWNNAYRQRNVVYDGDKLDTPSHPLVDNWQDLMARRTLKEAVDGGYDRLTWTTGAQQADRYDLAAHVSAIRYDKNENKLLFMRPGAKHDEWELFNQNFEGPEDIPGIIGKEPAKRLLAAPTRNGNQQIQGLDLKVGGEWATKLYDESMVNRFNKMGKWYGVKVDSINLHPDSAAGKFKLSYVDPISQETDIKYFDTMKEIEEEKKSILEFFDRGEIHESGIKVERTTGTGDRVHSFKITPEMKESIGKSRFHPFADLPGPAPKPALPAAPKLPDFHAEAAALDSANPVRYVGDFGGYPMFQQEDPGVGSFMIKPGETAETAFARAKERYRK